MADNAARLDILIDIKARLDEIAKASAGLQETKERATTLGELLRTGLGIGGGMEIARRGIEAFKATVIESVRESFRLASEIKDGAENLGLSRQAYQVLGEVMRDVGGEQSRMNEAIAANNRSLIEARQLVGPAADAYRKLGLNAAELEGLPVERRFEAIGRAVANSKDKTEAFSAAGVILGSRNLPALLNALKTLGVEGYDVLAEKIDRAGRLMSDDTIERLDRSQKAIEKWRHAVTIQIGESIGAFDRLRQVFSADFWGATGGFLKAALFGDFTSLANLAATVAPETKTPAPATDNSAAIANEARRSELQKLRLDLLKLELQSDQDQAKLHLTDDEKRTREITFLDRKAQLLAQIADLMKLLPAPNGDEAGKAAEIAKIEAEANKARTEAGNRALPLSESAQINRRYDAFSRGEGEGGSKLLNAPEGLMAGFKNWSMSVGTTGQQIASTIQGTIGGALSNVGDGIVGLITKTKTWGDMGRSVGLMFLQTLVQLGLQLGAQQVITWALALAHVGAERVKTAATIEGAAERTAATTAEAAKEASSSGIGAVLKSIMQLGPIAGPIVFATALAGMIALVSQLTRRETGGDVFAGQAYLVGEKRPEVFVPSQNGTIVPSVDRYLAASGSTWSSGSTSTSSRLSAPANAQPGLPQRMIIFTGDLFRARNLMRDPDWHNVFIDAGRATRGEVLAT